MDDAEEGRSEGVAVIVFECVFVSFRSSGGRRKGRNARVTVADLHQNARHLLLDHVLHERDVLVEALPRDLDNHVEDVAIGAFLQASRHVSTVAGWNVRRERWKRKKRKREGGDEEMRR